MKGRLLTLWLALNVLALVFANQIWWQITINTGDPATVVQGTGFDSDKAISAILLFGLAAWLLVIFTSGWLATIVTWVSSASTTALLLLTVNNFAHLNIGGITSNVSNHTGFAIKSFLGENDSALVSGQLQIWAWLFVCVLALLALLQLVIAIRSRGWAKKAKPKPDRTATKKRDEANDDPISLWDSQR